MMLAAAMCFFKAYAADDFCYRPDFNALDEGSFVREGWTCEGEVTVQTVAGENVLCLSDNSAAVLMPENTIVNNRVVLKMQITPLSDNGFTGVYLLNSNGKACFSLGLNKNGVFAVYTAGAWHTLCSYEQGCTYDMECVFDIEHSKFDVLIDGEACITDASFRNTPEIQQLKIYTENTCTQVKKLCLYSNTVIGVSVDGTAVYGGEVVPAGLSDIYIDFCKDINTATLNAETVVLRDGGAGTVIPCEGEYIAAERRYVLVPQEKCSRNTKLCLTIMGGKDGVRAENGGIISGSSVMLEFNALQKPAEVTAISVTEASFAVTVKNLTALSTEQCIFIAGFSGGRLAVCRRYNISQEPYRETVFRVEDTGDIDAEQIYAYIFDINDMIPVCERIAIKPE